MCIAGPGLPGYGIKNTYINLVRPFMTMPFTFRLHENDKADLVTTAGSRLLPTDVTVIKIQ